MQGCVRKDASPTSFLTFERSKVWLGEHEKSTENNGSLARSGLTRYGYSGVAHQVCRAGSSFGSCSQGSAGFSRATTGQASRRTNTLQPKSVRQPDHAEDRKKLRFSPCHRKGRRGASRSRSYSQRI